MVQQLSLHSVIDDDSFELLILTISKLSGRSPVIFANLNHVAVPNPKYDIEKVNAKNQLVEQTRIRIIEDIPIAKLNSNQISYKICGKLKGDDLPIDMKYLQSVPHNSSGDARPWCLNLRDIPYAGKDRKVCMQAMLESVISSTGGAKSSIYSFLGELGYVPEYQFIEIGTMFYMEDGLVFKIFKVWDLDNENDKTTLITKGGFLVKVYVNVAKSTDIEAINNGTANLLNIKRELKEYIDLTVPDRKCMDSRIGHLNDF
ncbi:HDL047Cp [Eremothecium sinecaudum]|uniref:Mediator of RNA polymerase II transcription subunit 18 n=1 Tax=Eremothecium sinecaudum TaxID=45286 RepID=A0A0X8HSK6_9SACH|nr:HDL047Cp [Eremothecium sinecaudum]AMD20697.1 HDL047Cp [Eremothecium sinecaudum]